MNKKHYNNGKLPKLWDFLVELHKTKPEAFTDTDFLIANVQTRWKSLGDKTRCPNCKASMLEYIFVLDFHNALLLKKMGDAVSFNLNKGMEFTEANKIHVVSMDAPDYTRHRTTQAAKLGLIAKVKLDGVHNRKEGWLITKRGFDALRGHGVPSWVKMWREEIIERSETRVTLQQVFEGYDARTTDQILAGKIVKDYRTHISDYDPMEWVNFGDVHNGEMI